MLISIVKVLRSPVVKNPILQHPGLGTKPLTGLQGTFQIQTMTHSKINFLGYIGLRNFIHMWIHIATNTDREQFHPKPELPCYPFIATPLPLYPWQPLIRSLPLL